MNRMLKATLIAFSIVAVTIAFLIPLPTTPRKQIIPSFPAPPSVPAIRGESGQQGERGEIGIPGEQGIPGERGPTGEKGEKGDEGDKGSRGSKGSPGQDGQDGAFPYTLQMGTYEIIGEGYYIEEEILFPVAFADTPLVFLNVEFETHTTWTVDAVAEKIGVDGFTVDLGSSDAVITINWLAISQ